MTSAAGAREIRQIAVSLLDDPELAMRDSFVDDAFDELCASIAAHGIQISLIVRPRAERFEVVAGHRRLAAARRLGLVTVPCDVRELADQEAECIKVLENEDRAAVNAADSALYIGRLFKERCGEDVDRVCAIVRRQRRYVEDRLALFAGDEDVFNALKAGHVSLGVALELNQITDRNYRLDALDQAHKYGMTIAAARETRKNANFATSGKPSPSDSGSPTAPVDDSPVSLGRVCYICNRSDKPERFRYVLVHEHCDLAIGQRVLSPFREEPAAEGTPNA